MKIKIVFDVDQVIRDLGVTVFKKFNLPPRLRKKWWHTYNGLSFYEWVDKAPEILSFSPVTKYYRAIKNYQQNNNIRLEFWTHQPKHWRRLTKNWLIKYFGNNIKVRFLTGKQKEKELAKNKNVYLVEDSPYFEKYNRVILIAKSYNSKCPAKYRVKTCQELEIVLRLVYNDIRK